MSKVDVSIILACYNEGLTLRASVDRIIGVLKKTKKSWEIIFVEDKSVDGTVETVKKLANEIKNSKVIFHKKNMGRGKSVTDGIKAARGNICGYLDVDLEVSESYILLFVDEIEKGNDMVVGRRFYEGGLKSFTRYLASKAYALMVNLLLKIPISDTEAGYKFFNRAKILPVLDRIRDNHWFWDTEICARSYWSDLTISEIPVLFVRRTDKKSTVKLFSDSWDYLLKILNFRKEVPRSF